MTSTTTSNTSLPAYPPKVHEEAKIISKQPLRAAEMEVSQGIKKDGEGAAQRLRGGCIPCPVRCIPLSDLIAIS